MSASQPYIITTCLAVKKVIARARINLFRNDRLWHLSNQTGQCMDTAKCKESVVLAVLYIG